MGREKIPRFARDAIRRLRRRRKGWSADRDREYHDVLFQSQDFDPFTFAYPGYITIRRFADLASPYLKNFQSVLDLGCGPAEITCELARRHPGIAFLGVDHSPAAIRRAEDNARSLGLGNVSFQVAAIEKFNPDKPVDLVTMFDALHHLTEPEAFIRRMAGWTSRFLLIEPRGDWKGSWRKDLDFDWLIQDLDKIRERLSYLSGEATKPASTGRPAGEKKGEAIEQRFTLDDFRKMFRGFGLRIGGTISGLEAYPPGWRVKSPSRERFWRLAYELYAEVDGLLRSRGLDLLAKHWVIYAEKGIPDGEIELPPGRPGPPRGSSIEGASDAEYLGYEGPMEATAGAEIRVQIKVRNRSFRVWSSREQETPDYLSYHWLDKRGAFVIWDGERTPLPKDIRPGEEADLMLLVKAPDRAGKYDLAVELVREGLAWFSDFGTPWLRLPFRVRKR